MRFKLPWKSSSLFVICMIAYVLFSPGRLQSLLALDRVSLITLELLLAVFGGFNFLVMFNQDVISEATFREYYGWLMYIVHWIAVAAVFLLMIGIIAEKYFFRYLHY